MSFNENKEEGWVGVGPPQITEHDDFSLTMAIPFIVHLTIQLGAYESFCHDHLFPRNSRKVDNGKNFHKPQGNPWMVRYITRGSHCNNIMSCTSICDVDFKEILILYATH